MSDQGYRRRLSALLSADVEGYSRLMREDEDTTIRTVTEYRAAITDLVRRYRGRVVDSPGDNILAVFGSVVDAVNCAVEIQRDLAERNLDLAENRRMKWRIGVNLGDVVQDGERIYGDGVNVAARMEGLAEGGGICLSGTVYDSIVNKLGLEYEYLGEQAVKNISKPIRAYRVLSYPGAAAHRVVRARKAESKRWRKITMAAAAVVVVGAAVLVWYCSLRSPSTRPPSAGVKPLALPDKPSIAVLPFVNLSGDPKQDYFSDGFADEIIYGLSRVPGIFVIARQSSFTYKGKNVKVRRVGRELGVRYVLEGSVRRAGDKVRITAQLIEARTGHHLWAASYDRRLKDIFALQDEITLKIISAIGAKLTRGERARMLAKGTANIEACLAVMKGFEYWHRSTVEANIQARQQARRAIALDPKYPAAYCLLGQTYFMDVWLGSSRSPGRSYQKALQLYQKVLAMDKRHPMANGLVAFAYGLQRRYQEALAQADRAVALNPGSAASHLSRGIVLLYVGRYQEAVFAIEKAVRLNPKGPGYYFLFLGSAYRGAGQYDRAIAAYKQARALSPHFLPVLTGLAACYSATGRAKQARAMAAEILKLNPRFTVEWYSRTLPWKDRAALKRHINALRRAGLK
jgi:adenylate cyclase